MPRPRTFRAQPAYNSYMRTILAAALLIVVLASGGPASAQTPNVNDNGVVDAASFRQPVAPGSIVSIFGTNFASGLATASTVPLSTSLGGTSVTFNGLPAPLFFVGPLQINAQLPSGLTGNSANIVVTNAAGSSVPKAVAISPTAPGIFSVNQAGTGQGWVLFANSAVVAAPAGSLGPTIESRPAKPGDILTIYANGLGPVSPPVADGNNTLDGLRRTTNDPTILIGGVTVPSQNVLFSGLAPQFVALYQINFTLPSGVPSGDSVPVQISIGGATSTDKLTMAIQ